MGDKFVRNQVSMERFLKWFGVSVPKDGFINCPAHSDSRPSLKVYGGKKGFYCYQCQAGGGPVEFYMLFKGVNFRIAKKTLMGAFGISNEVNDKVKANLNSREQLSVDNVILTWHRLFLNRLWDFLNGLPKELYLLTYIDWLEYGPKRLDYAMESARRLKSFEILDGTQSRIFDFLKFCVFNHAVRLCQQRRKKYHKKSLKSFSFSGKKDWTWRKRQKKKMKKRIL